MGGNETRLELGSVTAAVPRPSSAYTRVCVTFA